VVSGSVRSTLASEWSPGYSETAGYGTPGCVLGGTYATKWKWVFHWVYELTLGKYRQRQVVDVDACDVTRSYTGFDTEAEAEAQCLATLETCEDHCLNDLAGCSDYCGSPRSTHCYPCLNWDPIWPSHPDYSLVGSGWGIGKYIYVFGGPPPAKYACGARCFCTSHQGYYEWVCS
jgi:hypothetical protein